MATTHSTKPSLPLVAVLGGGILAALVAGVFIGTRNSAPPPTIPDPVPIATPAPEPISRPVTAVDRPPTIASPPPTLSTPPPAPPSFPTTPPPAQLTPVAAATPTASLSELNTRLEGLRKVSSDPSRNGALMALGAQLAAHLSPEQLNDWLAELEDPNGKSFLTRGFLTGLTAAEPKAAARLALDVENALPNSGLTVSLAMYQVTQAWAKKDPAATADFLATVEDKRIRADSRRALAHQWALTDPASALAWGEAQDEMAPQLVSQIARTYSQRHATEAVEGLFAMEPGILKDAYLAGIAAAWVAIDADTAMAAVGTIGDRSQRISATHQAVVRWANTDPKAAAAWTVANADDSMRSALQQNIARAWTARDPVAALGWAAEQDDLDTREKLVAAAAPQAVWRQPDLAVSTVASLPEGRLKNQAVERLVNNWAQRDPAAAAQFVIDNELATPNRDVANVAYQWGRRDADATAAWASELPTDGSRWNAVLGAAAGAAAMRDGRLIGQWRQTMQRGNLSREETRQWLNRPEIPESVRQQLLPLVE